jgi:hypothetical protein
MAENAFAAFYASLSEKMRTLERARKNLSGVSPRQIAGETPLAHFRASEFGGIVI